MEKITRKNPESMPKPVGNYSHITRVPKGAGLFVTSGQVGTDIDGQIPSSLNDQVTNTFENIKKILESEGLNEEHVIKGQYMGNRRNRLGPSISSVGYDLQNSLPINDDCLCISFRMAGAEN